MVSKLKIKLQDESNGTYQGFVNDQNKKDIFGVFLWDSGDFYIGEWKDNKINGQGIIYFNSGGYIEGNFSDSYANSRALLVFPNNDSYFANWKRGQLDGKVSMLFKGSKKLVTSVYEDGHFRKIESIKENVKEIKAVNEFLSKCDITKLILKYSQIAAKSASENPTAQSNSPISFSKINFQDGGFFIGITSNNIPSGLGLFQYSDQKFDCGLYQNGFLNGNGRKNFSNGDFYDGKFMNGKFEGEGIIYHKAQSIYYHGLFQENILTEEKQKGDGYPRDILNRIKNIDHGNGINYTNEIVQQEWIKLSLLHNLQFIGSTMKSDQINLLKSSSHSHQTQQFISSSAHSSSRNKDNNTQKYHQKNLDTVYFLNQKIRAAQTPTNHSSSSSQQPIAVSKVNAIKKEMGNHRKNQASLDFIRTGIETNFNSLQKIKSEYMTLPSQNESNLSVFAAQTHLQQANEEKQDTSRKDLEVNSSQKLKSQQNEDYQEEGLQQRKSSSTLRKQSAYLSPSARPLNTAQYNHMLSPQTLTSKNKKILNSPSDQSVNKLQKMMGTLNLKTKLTKGMPKTELSPQPNQNRNINLQSPTEIAQKAVNCKLNSMKTKPKNEIFPQNNRNENINSQKQRGSFYGKQAAATASTLVSQKSQSSFNRVTSPSSNQTSKGNDLKSNDKSSLFQASTLTGDTIYRGCKTPNNYIEESIDLGSQKEISSDLSKLKYDSQGDLLKENNRSGQLSQPNLSKPKSSAHSGSNNNTLNKQKSQETKGFIVSGLHSQLNNTPQRQSHKNSQNQEKGKKGNTHTANSISPFQTEEAMKHYYQTRIKKQLPEEIEVKVDYIKSKQSVVLSTKSCSSNSINGSYSIQSQIKQKLLNPKVQQFKKKNDIQQQLNKNKIAQTFHSSLKNKQNLDDQQNSKQINLKTLKCVKSQDNLINDDGCSFSSLQEQQQTLPDEYSKSKFSKLDQFKIETGLECFTQEEEEDEDVLQNEELTTHQQNHNSSCGAINRFEGNDEEQDEEEEYENNENENCLNKQNFVYTRKSDLIPYSQPKLEENNASSKNPMLLRKGFSVEDNCCSNENIQSNNIQQESKNLRSTISDQIKHILTMQKNSNGSKHKFSMKPFILQGGHSNKQQPMSNFNNRQSENQTSSTLPQSYHLNEKQLHKTIYQNPLHILTSNSSQSKIEDITRKKEDSSISPLEVPLSKGERHILTPFHTTKSQLQKGAQSTNLSNKSQSNESIRSINQKMSSYLSFQERLNAIGQCIYKKDWNTTQSLNSIRSLSRNGSTLVEKNLISEDNSNLLNPKSVETIQSKEELSLQQNSNKFQQPNVQTQHVNQLVANYLQAQNNVSETNSTPKIPSLQTQNQPQSQDNGIQIIETIQIPDKIDSLNNFENEKEEEFTEDKLKQELLFDEIIQSNYNSILQEEKVMLQSLENSHNHAFQQQVVPQNVLEVGTQDLLQIHLKEEKIDLKFPSSNIIQELEKNIGKESEDNFGVLKTEEGEGDSINKNDLACLQLKGLNDSFNNSDGSCNLNELQIDQKHFNEEDLLGINALDEIFSQNSDSLCSFTPPKQDTNSNHQPFNQQGKLSQNDFFLNGNNNQQIDKRDFEDDLEFQRIFDCKLNLENLDIFTISQQPLGNENYPQNKNNRNQRQDNIEDILELSPINMKDNNFDDPFQQQQMITEFHFYEDLLLQQKIPNESIGHKNGNTLENNYRYNHKYKPNLEIIDENASEDQYTSPKKRKQHHHRQIFPCIDGLDVVVTQIQF